MDNSINQEKKVPISLPQVSYKGRPVLEWGGEGRDRVLARQGALSTPLYRSWSATQEDGI